MTRQNIKYILKTYPQLKPEYDRLSAPYIAEIKAKRAKINAEYKSAIIAIGKQKTKLRKEALAELYVAQSNIMRQISPFTPRKEREKSII